MRIRGRPNRYTPAKILWDDAPCMEAYCAELFADPTGKLPTVYTRIRLLILPRRDWECRRFEAEQRASIHDEPLVNTVGIY